MEAEDLENAAVAVLEKAYLDKTKEKATLIQVSSRWHRVSLASIIVSSCYPLDHSLIYLIFPQNPLKRSFYMDTAFIKVDYSGVITQLEGIALSSLSNDSKHLIGLLIFKG